MCPRRPSSPGTVAGLLRCEWTSIRCKEPAVNARARLQVAPHGATVLVERGLERPEDLKAFHDGSAAVIEGFRKLAGG